ncbi:MAG: hypothetical protein LAO21_17035 [Acidobacteriia bacterium]|nr:hypothetical protein [Terriglobia bacterium]
MTISSALRPLPPRLEQAAEYGTRSPVKNIKHQARGDGLNGAEATEKISTTSTFCKLIHDAAKDLSGHFPSGRSLEGCSVEK